MKKQQVLLISGAIILFAFIFFIANKMPPKAEASEVATTQQPATVNEINLPDQEKNKLSAGQKNMIESYEAKTSQGSETQRIAAFHELSHFWKDSLKNPVLAAFYDGEKAKLENSEKNLNFAANSLLNYLMVEHDPSTQKWLALQSKDLFERSLKLQPGNDSAVIGLGATYMFGNISDNPMEGIMKVREVAEKNPDNIYAQKMLGFGGMKSGQFANAAKRFEKVLEKEPDNVMAIFSIAECYEQLSDKQNAIKWYKIAKEKVTIPEMQKEIDERIRDLQLR